VPHHPSLKGPYMPTALITGHRGRNLESQA